MLFLTLCLCSGGCSMRRKPVSHSRIILEGDDNPHIRDTTARAGDAVRYSNTPRQAVQEPVQTESYQQPIPQ